MRGLKRKSDSSEKGIQSIYIHVHCLQNAFPIKYSTNKNDYIQIKVKLENAEVLTTWLQYFKRVEFGLFTSSHLILFF